MVTRAVRARGRRASQRRSWIERAAGVFPRGADRKTVRHRSRRPDDAAIRARLQRAGGERRRFGYRRLHILLLRRRASAEPQETQRLYREEGLTVRRRKGRRRGVGVALRRPSWHCPTNVGASISSTTNSPTGGVSACSTSWTRSTRECLAAIPDTSISGKRVVARTRDARRPARRPEDDRQRQWNRVHLERRPRLVGRARGSTGITSNAASRPRTASSRASTAACATSC